MEERFVIQNYQIIDGDKYPTYYGSNYYMYENMQQAIRYKTRELAQSDMQYVSENCEGITEIIPVMQDEKSFRIELKKL